MGTLKLILLAPMLAVQALWVVLRATRLPEAAGPREGQSGTGPPLRVLILGDSSAAGVGVTDQREALGGQVAQSLGCDFTVFWQVIAKSGGTAASTRSLLAARPAGPFDIVVTALGVNDSKNGVSGTVWRKEYTQLIADLRSRSPNARIYLSGVPPLGAFPLLPSPLSRVLGQRADKLDAILHEIATAHEATIHLTFDLPMEPEKMARDGFHPGPEVYTYWAQMITDHIRRDLT